MIDKKQKQEILNETLQYQQIQLKKCCLSKIELNNIEFLPIAVLRENFSDYSACEDKWKTLQEIITNNKSPLDFIKFRFETMRKIVEENHPNEYYPIYEEEVFTNALLLGKPIEDMMTIYRVRTTYPKCPLCGASIFTNTEALSRKDNETMICSDCGLKEAIEDFVDNE